MTVPSLPQCTRALGKASQVFTTWMTSLSIFAIVILSALSGAKAVSAQSIVSLDLPAGFMGSWSTENTKSSAQASEYNQLLSEFGVTTVRLSQESSAVSTTTGYAIFQGSDSQGNDTPFDLIFLDVNGNVVATEYSVALNWTSTGNSNKVFGFRHVPTSLTSTLGYTKNPGTVEGFSYAVTQSAGLFGYPGSGATYIVNEDDNTHTWGNASSPPLDELNDALEAIYATANPQLTVTKTVDTAVSGATYLSGGASEVVDHNSDSTLSDGDRVYFTVTLENTGNSALSDVSVVSDTLTRGDGTGLTIDSFVKIADTGTKTTDLIMAVGDIWTYSAYYTLTADDIADGTLNNIAKFSATPIAGSELIINSSPTGSTTETGSVTTVTFASVPPPPSDDGPPPVLALPELTVSKVADVTDAGVGETITYTITAENTGNVTLTYASFTDAKTADADESYLGFDADAADATNALSDTGQSAPTVAIAPGEAWVWQATYTVTQTDIDAGKVENTAVVGVTDGTTPFSVESSTGGNATTGGGKGTPTVTNLTQTPELTVSKVADVTDAGVGETITYTITAENTGNVTLTYASFTDAKTADADESYLGFDADASDATNALSDTGEASPTVAIAPGEAWVWQATYTVTQTDIDAGKVENTAVVGVTDGTTPFSVESSTGGNATTGGGNGSPTVTNLTQTPELTVSKVADVTDAAVGETITYTITAENTGNVTLTYASFTDAKTADADESYLGFDADASDATNALSDTGEASPTVAIAPGEAWVWQATYTVTQTDIDAGKVENTAVVGVTDGTTPFSVESSTGGNATTGGGKGTPTVTNLTQTPELTVSKVADVTDAAVGETITYTITAENTGNVTLTNASFTDAKTADADESYLGFDADAADATNALSDTGEASPTVAIAPGEAWVWQATYTVTQADIDAGKVENTAVVGVTDGTTPFSVESSTGGNATTGGGKGTPTVTNLTQTPAISVVKTSAVADTSGNKITDAGDTITYSFVVKNTGNVSLTNVVLSEPQDKFTGVGTAPAPVYVGGDSDGDGDLDTNETWTYTADYVLKAGDVEVTAPGFIENQAYVTADVPNSSTSIGQVSGSVEDSDDATTTFLGSITGTLVKNSAAVSGITVRLVNSANKVIATTTTDAEGAYFFTNMPADDYQVRFVSADGTAYTGVDGKGDQNVDGGLNSVDAVNVAYGVGAIRNFQEVNGIAIDPSGVIYDPVSRLPISGATVRLMFNGAAIPDPATWLLGGTDEQTTGADGVYAFFLQDPAQTGVYTLEVDAPAGYQDITATTEPVTIAPQAMYDGTTSLGGGIVEIVPNAAAPQAGDDTTYHLAFDLAFGDWTDLATLSNGVIHNHIPLEPESMAMTVTKVAQAVVDPKVGQDVVFTVTAENTGNGSYAAVQFDDPLTEDAREVFETVDANGTLDPGEIWEWTVTYTLTGDDMARGRIENLATVQGTTPSGSDEVFESAPNGNATKGAGNGTPTVVELGALIPLIEEDLKTILSDDLAATMRQQSAGMQSHATSARSRLEQADRSCGDAVTRAVNDQDIKFAVGSAVILPESDAVLDDIAQAIAQCSADERLNIDGHTDNRGSDAYNQDLSERRAASVKRALVARDIPAAQLQARGFGESRPIATNDTEEGMQKNRRVEFVSVPVTQAVTDAMCADTVDFDRNTDITASKAKTVVNSDFKSQVERCDGNAWRTFEGRASLLSTDDGMDQWMFNISLRNETRVNADTVRGWFIGAYGSRNQITGLATGEIDGYGINGGIFGARRMAPAVFLDYYAGMSAGQHRFDLTFDRGFDINATGDYRYLAYYGGVALSGEIERGAVTLAPRVGLDLAYTNGADVDVTASNAFRSETGAMRLNAMSGGRVYGEVTIDTVLGSDENQETALSMTPKAFCDRPIGKTTTECGFGARVEYSQINHTNGSNLSVILSAEQSKASSSRSIGLSYGKELLNGAGRSSATMSLDKNMQPQVGYNLSVDF